MSLWSRTYSRHPHGFWDDARILEVGVHTAVFLLRMADFADRNMTDGRVTDAQLRALGQLRACRLHADRLQSAGLLQRLDVPPAWEIVGFLDVHRTRSEIEAKREKARSAGVRSGEARRSSAAEPSPDVDDLVEQLDRSLLEPEQSSTEQSSTEQSRTRKRRRARSTQDLPDVAGAAAAVMEILYGQEAAAMNARQLLAAATAEGILEATRTAMTEGWHPADLQAVAARAAAEANRPIPYWRTIVNAPPPTRRLDTAADIAEFLTRFDSQGATA